MIFEYILIGIILGLAVSVGIVALLAWLNGRQ